MKRRTKKISRVVSLAAAEERRLGEQTGRSQRGLDEQLHKLGELNAYRHNYASKNPGTSGSPAVRWKDYQSFMQRLDRAVVSQQQIIRDCEQKMAAHRERWLVKRQRLESLERVLETSRNRDAAYESRLEQRQLDDLAISRNPVGKMRNR